MLLFLLFFIVINATTHSDFYHGLTYDIDKSYNSTVHSKILIDRLKLLRKINELSEITLSKASKDTCNYEKIVRITEFQWGRSGNNMISFTHTLFIATMINATLLVPKYMAHIFIPFDTHHLHDHFCFYHEGTIPWDTTSVHPTNVQYIDITSEDSFFILNIFFNKEYTSVIPTKFMNLTIENYDELIHEMTKFFIHIYTSLWSFPLPTLTITASHIVENYLNDKFDYFGIHKRSMEGGCDKLMYEHTILGDFSPNDLPLNSSHWNNGRQHPLCNMPASFIKEIALLHHYDPHNKMFVAFDGRGNVDDYLALPENQAVFSSVIDHNNVYKAVDKRMLDMYITINSKLFILNPQSTFSWEIFIIHSCLGLDSVPIVHDDFYMRKGKWKKHFLNNEDKSSPLRWVRWNEIDKLCKEYRDKAIKSSDIL